MMVGAIVGTIAIVLVTILIGLYLDRKAPVVPKPQEAVDRKKLAIHAAGEAPATALRLRDGQLDKLRSAQRCPRCRAQMESRPDDHVRYNDADLMVLHFACVNCEGKRTVYVTTGAA